MLEVGNGGMTFDDYKSHFSLWALVKAPLILGANILDLDEQTMQIISGMSDGHSHTIFPITLIFFTPQLKK